MFSIIAAIGQNRELGKKGQLVFHLKDDMQFFRETTNGHTVIMGRKTWESLPGKLKDRRNLVVSRRSIEGADETITDLSAFIAANSDTPEEIFVIGGALIYDEFLPYAKALYLTEIDATAPDADAFFPNFDKNQYSREIIKKGKEDDLDFVISKYTKI